MMSFDDGATDGESDTHPVTFCCVEGVKQLVHDLRVDPDAGIAYHHAHTIAPLSLGSDQQLPWAVINAYHRVGSIAQQVQDDLLELDPIANDSRQVLSKFRLKNDSASVQVTRRQRNDLARGLIQIERLECEFFLAEERP